MVLPDGDVHDELRPSQGLGHVCVWRSLRPDTTNTYSEKSFFNI